MNLIDLLDQDYARILARKVEVAGASEHARLVAEGIVILAETGLRADRQLRARIVALDGLRSVMGHAAVAEAELSIAGLMALAAHCARATVEIGKLPVEARLARMRDALAVMVALQPEEEAP